MVRNLAIASVFTLSLLFAMLLAVLLTAFYALGYVNWVFLISATLIINFLMWFLSPYIGDFTNQIFYKARFIGIEGLRDKNRNVAELVEKICMENKIKIPKIGYIADDNPQAFTYGSTRNNARIIFTEGIFTYLDEEEIKAVFAHELGHIVHRDFIVMAIASTILQLLYELYWILTRSASSNRGKGKGYVVIVGIISYVFYMIGSYILLYLSRVREYYADEFSAKATGNPNTLAHALVKIAYGIIAKPDKPEEMRLMASTRAMGITDYKLSKGLGLIYANANIHGKDINEYIKRALLYDLKNPWAFFIELGSTHPLTGKRIERLSRLAKLAGISPFVDFSMVESGMEIDRSRLYKGFIKDVIVKYLPFITISLLGIAIFLAFILLPALFIHLAVFWLIGLFIALFGISIMLQTAYKYKEGLFEKKNVLELMADIYASPIKGRPVELEGKIIGRGQAGYIFSEDMMLQDNTGLIYLNYESLLPFLGNLFFAWKKVDKLVGREVKVKGWFIRGMRPLLEMKELEHKEGIIKGRVRAIGMLSGGIFLILGIAMLITFL
ncbi:MAG TPA: peptidase M48 [Candidatus Aenigmarchaeota archaeon]|nr:MAG: peptidase M48 [Candidatus Aenigmarchaeota archaeon]HDD46370.1 peptidase M48 [Candidatus Aenigmarchaeota archaeon]